MSTQTISRAAEIIDIIDRMPPDSVIIQHGVDWNDYEELLEAVGEARGLRISYSEGRLQIMTLSPKHEKYTRLLDLLVGLELHQGQSPYHSQLILERHGPQADSWIRCRQQLHDRQKCS